MIKLEQCTRVGGDETAGYSISMDKKYTVSEFISDVVDGNNWGYIEIKSKTQGYLRIDYDREDGIKQGIPPKFMGLFVLSAMASGGWYNMNYYLETE